VTYPKYLVWRGKRMAKMNDYSGDYRNNFDLSDLSKEALIRLIDAYKKVFLDWFTYTEKIVGAGLGDKTTAKEVHAMFVEAGNDTLTQLAIPELKEALNLQDDETIEYKYYQICCDVEGLKKGYYGNSKKIQNFLTNYPKKFDFSGISHEQCVKVVRSFRRIYQGYRDISSPKYAAMYYQKGIGDKLMESILPTMIDHTKYSYYPVLRKAMKIEGDDVVSKFKFYQIGPDGIQNDTYKLRMEITDRYDVIYIGELCYTALKYEEAGQIGGLMALCGKGEGSFEHTWYYALMEVMNPKMKMAWPVLPPRKSKDDIFCKFRFWVEKKDRTLPWENGEGYIH
jgi:hypothetical protein